MLRFDANLYRIAMKCSSREETRYLQGVFIEPHAIKGVTMTATDGYRLICIHDESGAADESAVVKLSAEALKACKPAKFGTRFVVVEDDAATVRDFIAYDNDGFEPRDAVAITARCRVDGTFPDWRHVVPQGPVALEQDEPFAHFSGALLADMGAIGVELEKHFDRYTRHMGSGPGMTQILTASASKPALIRWNRCPEAFGVLMPVRGEALNSTPDWFNATAPIAEAAE